MQNKASGFAFRKFLAHPGGVSSPDISMTSPFSASIGMSDILQGNLQAQSIGQVALKAIKDRVQSLRIPPSPTAMPTVRDAHVVAAESIDEQLFNATAKVKILTSQVAMHLDKAWRDRLFQQLDSLHDPDEWDEGDKPVQQASFSTFLKAIFFIKPKVRPGLGLSSTGHLIAAWTEGKNRLTIEFLPGDRVRWVVSRYPEGELEQYAGTTRVDRLLQGLASHTPEAWFWR